VELRPPKIYSQTVRVWVVYALERDAKDKAIEWMLITTHPVENFADAQKRVEWYSGRWGIEVFHRALKSGCRVKDRQLATADRLETCLALDMVVAWRIYYLTMLGQGDSRRLLHRLFQGYRVESPLLLCQQKAHSSRYLGQPCARPYLWLQPSAGIWEEKETASREPRPYGAALQGFIEPLICTL